MFFEVVVSVMEGTANLVVYRDGEIIRNTHESEVCVPESVFICGSMHHDVNGASERSLSKHGERYVEESEQYSVLEFGYSFWWFNTV